jgi:GNAT superfamily N-acetyltransferase
VRLTVRDSGPAEAQVHFAIQREASVAALAHIFPPAEHPYPDDEVLDGWRRFGGRAFLAERDGRPVGLAAVDFEWLHGLYVVPAEWGSGVADALHDRAVAEIRVQHDVAKLWCLERNHRARRFYEQRAWRLNGETRVVPFPPNPLDVGYSLAL